MAPCPQLSRDRQQAGGQPKVIGSKCYEKDPHGFFSLSPYSQPAVSGHQGRTLGPGWSR